jgi:hypothetical protein
MSVYTAGGAERFHLSAVGAANPAVQASGLQALSTPSLAGRNEAKPWHPSSPMFAVGVLIACTFAAMAVGTGGKAGASFHVGPATASVAGSAGLGK